MNSDTLMLWLIIVIFAAGCGGGGEVIDLIPDPEEPFIVSYGLDAADMDGDGLTDIVIAGRLVSPDDSTTGHIDILLQDITAPGSFFERQRYPTNALPHQAKLADLNGDGLPDVIATNKYSDNSFDVLLNEPLDAGKLRDATRYSTSSEPLQADTGDIDRDGFTDIVVAGNHNVTWHRQQANGSFNNSEIIGTGVDTLALEDLDGNGLLDVVTHDGTIDGNLLVYLQSTAVPGQFSLQQTERLGTFLGWLDLGDLNRDGLSDVAVASGDVKDIADFFPVWYPVWQTSSNPPVFDAQPRYKGAGFDGYRIVIADMNGDGRADVVLGNFSGAGKRSNVQIFLQTDVAGQFRMDSTYALPVNSEPHIRNDMYGLSIADLNGDLLPDIAVSNSRVYVLFQDQGMPGRFDQPVLLQGADP